MPVPRAVCILVILVASSGAAIAGVAGDGCRVVRYPDIAIMMHGLTPVVSVKINGTPESLILDSGAAYSALSQESAAQLNLPQYPANYYVVGATGGTMRVAIATASTFSFADADFHNVNFQVEREIFGADIVGLLGENVLRLADVEYDLADGVVRLLTPVACQGRPLAYWATSQPVSVVDLERASVLHPLPIGPVMVDGNAIRAVFDTGGQHSIMSLHAAKLAGITPRSPGVIPAGTVYGLGGEPLQVWSAPFASIDIGGEKILHTHVLIGRIAGYDFDMILGGDFFLAHRIYADNSGNKLYFTYNGGPVFNLNTPPSDSQAPRDSLAAAADLSSSASSNEPTDAGGFMRRGMAQAARHELAAALADLSRACQLSPHDPQVFYQRALVYRRNGDPARALADLDTAVALDANDLDARAARAALRLADRLAVEPDLAAIDHAAQPEADVRLTAAYDYTAIGDYAAAVHQYDVWIDSHAADKGPWLVTRLTATLAFSNRCWAEAAARINLDRALRDCDKALDLLPRFPDALENRALAHLQRGELGPAIRDYDAALQLKPRSAEALYGRGLAEMRSGKPGAGHTDVAAALAVQSDIGQRFASFGLEP